MHRFGSGKHSLADSEVTVPLPKRPRVEKGGDGSSRKKFLNELRAICDRWIVHIKVDGSEVAEARPVDGKEVLRLFLLDLLGPKGKKFPLRDCKCRHAMQGTPSGTKMCQTAGTVDQGKANAFVMSDLKKDLRAWLKAKQRRQSDVVSDIEDSEEEGSDGGEIHESIPSSYVESVYPSSPNKPGEPGYKRRTTKQRVTVLFYLYANANSRDSFSRAFKGLCDSSAQLVHLCGCGLSIGELKGSCVVGSHMKLASAELNREHIHYHFVLENAPDRASYLKMHGALKGGAGGKFDDVF